MSDEARGYELVEPRELDALAASDPQKQDVAICLLCWLASELKRALPKELDGVDVDVLWVYRGYPALGLHYASNTNESVAPIVERTATELLAQNRVDDLVAFAARDEWLTTRDRLHVEKNISALAKQIAGLVDENPAVHVETLQRALGGTTRLKVERAMSGHKRYVDFAFNAAPDEPLAPCFVWSFGEYAHADHQQNFDGKRYGPLADAATFVERWIFAGLSFREMPAPRT